MDHAEIHGEWWEIPAERTKMRREHRVYLSGQAREQVGQGTGAVFPARIQAAVTRHNYFPSSANFRLTNYGPPTILRSSRQRHATHISNETQERKGMERLLTEPEAADRLGMKYAGLRSMRGKGTGPAFVRLGSLVRYRPEDLSAWVDSHRVTTDPTGTEAPKSAA